MKRQRGLTLIELVIGIAISGILSLVLVQFISSPMTAYAQLSRRASLVDQAQLAMRRMTLDLRRSVPNSVRVGCGGRCVEFLHVLASGHYRSAPPGDPLSFRPQGADDRFDVLGPLRLPTRPIASSRANACREGRAACVIIHNTGQPGFDAWAGDNAATLRALSRRPTRIHFVNSGFRSGRRAFPAPSPDQRFYLSDTAVTYLCDTRTHRVTRYQGYRHARHLGSARRHLAFLRRGNPAESALLSTQVEECAFRYRPATAQRPAILHLRLRFSADGERVTLEQQIPLPPS